MSIRKALLVCGLLGMLHCGGGASWPRVLDPSDIVDLREGTPHITRVRDLGNPHIGQAGPLRARSDGLFTVGELVLIEGRGLGKQPTVLLAGRPAEVLWRTQGGGIIARLPPGVAAGPRRLEVGPAAVTLGLHRLGLLLHRGRLHAVDVGGGAGLPPSVTTLGAPQPLAGGKGLCVAASGDAAYVLTGGPDRDQVVIVDLGAPGGPQVTGSRDLSFRAYAITCAERAPHAAVVGAEHVSVWDLTDAQRPAPWRAARLPEEAQRATAAALDPGGTLLALTVPEGNRVVLVDVKPGTKEVAPELVAQVDALPAARQPLLVEARFASDGATIWAVAGDNPASHAAGHQPTRLLAIAVGAPEASTELGRTQRELKVTKTVDLPDAGTPVRLALQRTLPEASGATIRTPPEKAVLFLSAVGPEALSGGPITGSLLRADPGAGQGSGTTVLHSGSELISGLDLNPDGTVAVAAVLGEKGTGVLVYHNDSGAMVTLSLTLEPEKELRPPFGQAQVAVQP